MCSIPTDTCIELGLAVPPVSTAITNTEERGTNADKIWGYSGCTLFFLCQLLMCRARRMDHKRLCVPDVRQIARQPQRIDHLAADHCISALHTETEHAAERSPSQRFEGQLVGRVRLEADVGDPGDFVVALEVSRECERVVRVTLRTERECLEALQEKERAERVEGCA